jgi:hypothetical protein
LCKDIESGDSEEKIDTNAGTSRNNLDSPASESTITSTTSSARSTGTETIPTTTHNDSYHISVSELEPTTTPTVTSINSVTKSVPSTGHSDFHSDINTVTGNSYISVSGNNSSNPESESDSEADSTPSSTDSNCSESEPDDRTQAAAATTNKLTNDSIAGSLQEMKTTEPDTVQAKDNDSENRKLLEEIIQTKLQGILDKQIQTQFQPALSSLLGEIEYLKKDSQAKASIITQLQQDNQVKASITTQLQQEVKQLTLQLQQQQIKSNQEQKAREELQQQVNVLKSTTSTNNTATSSCSTTRSTSSSNDNTTSLSSTQSYASKVASPNSVTFVANASTASSTTTSVTGASTEASTTAKPPVFCSNNSQESNNQSNKDKPNKSRTDYTIVVRGIKSTSASEDINNRAVEKKLIDEYNLLSKDEWKQATKKWFGLSTTIATGGRKKDYNHFSSVISLALPSSDIADRILRQKRSNEILNLLQEDKVYITRLMTKEELIHSKDVRKRRRDNAEEAEQRRRKEYDDQESRQQQRQREREAQESPSRSVQYPNSQYPNLNYQNTHPHYYTRSYDEERLRQFYRNDARRY